MILKLGNQSLEIDKNYELYNTIRTMFVARSIEYAEGFVERYERCNNFDEASNLYMAIVSKATEDSVERACQYLFNIGIYDVSVEEFYARYYNEYLCVDDMLEPVTQRLEEIASIANDLELSRQLKKLNRAYWEGGGFGVKGAITGAVSAAVMNTAFGAFYAMGDYFRGCNNKAKVNKLKSQLFHDPQVLSTLYYSIVMAYQRCHLGLCDELINNNLLNPISLDNDYAKRLNSNAMRYSKDKEQQKELIIKSIFANPYNELHYDPLFQLYPTVAGLNEFASFFGVDALRNAFNRLDLMVDLKEARQLYGDNYLQLALAADAYIVLSAKYNYDVSNEMQVLSKEFVSVCPNIEETEEAIRYLKDFFAKEIKKVAVILHALDNHKSHLEAVEEAKRQAAEQKRKEELKRIQTREFERLSKRTCVDKFDTVRAIKAVIEYSDKYNADASSLLYRFLLRLNTLTSDYIDDVDDTITRLNELKCKRYPQIDQVISGYQIKKKVHSWDQTYGVYSFYVCSPVIIDLVNEARKGNPIVQQWLVGLLYQKRFFDSIRTSYLKGNLEEKKRSQKAIDVISDIVMFLFDKPDLYSFDLFMRIKASYPFMESIEEYIESLEAFSHNEKCVAGSYEYGMLLCENNKQNIGLPILKAAAESGYDQAAQYLHTLYSSLDKFSFQTLYYDVIRHTPYSASSHLCCRGYKETDEMIIKMVRILHDLLTESFSIYATGEEISKKLYEILDSQRYPFAEWNIGYLGDISDKLVLKTAKLALSIPSNEKTLLSYTHKTEKSTCFFAISESHFYYGKNGTVSKIAFSDPIVNFNAEQFRGFGDRFSRFSPIYQVYLIAHCFFKKYSENTAKEILEKMAMVGNPLAVCNLLAGNTSDDKKEILFKQKANWEKSGKYYAVCPQCHKERSREDTYCPDCGAKI